MTECWFKKEQDNKGGEKVKREIRIEQKRKMWLYSKLNNPAIHSLPRENVSRETFLAGEE